MNIIENIQKKHSENKFNTVDGREYFRNKIKTTRQNAKAAKDKKLANILFPPVFDPQKKIFETCVRNYINATKPESLETVECGICGESVKKIL